VLAYLAATRIRIQETLDEVTVWSELARTLFTFKEFIYVR
jgi:hypothetical protein